MAKAKRTTKAELPDTRPSKVKEYDSEDLVGMAEDAQRAALEKSGGALFLKLPIGETELHFPKQNARVTTNKFGDSQALFRCYTVKDDKEWDLAFKLASPMTKKLAAKIALKKAFELTIVRAGDTRDTTTYSIKE